MENFFTSETLKSFHSFCVIFICLVGNTLFLGRLFAEFLWHKYLLRAKSRIGKYNWYIYAPLIFIAISLTVFPIIGFDKDVYPELFHSRNDATLKFLIVFFIPSLICLFFIRFTNEFITKTFYKFNLRIIELKILITLIVIGAIIIYSGPLIFYSTKSNSDVFLSLLFLIITSLPMIELLISSIKFLNKSIKVQQIINFKIKKMKWIEEVTSKHGLYSGKNNYLPIVDIRSYLVIKHGWDFMYMHPDDGISLNEHSGFRTSVGVSNEPKFIIHENIRKLFPSAIWSSENQEYNPAVNAPSTLLSEVLIKNKKIKFEGLYHGDDVFKKFTTKTLNRVYRIYRLNHNDFEVQEVDYDVYENEHYESNIIHTIDYNFFKAPNYDWIQLSLND